MVEGGIQDGADAPRASALALAPLHVSERLVSLLAKKPGTREQKVEWLDQNIDLMIAELEKEGVQNPAQNWGALKSRIFRWYARHLANPDHGKPTESFEQKKMREIREFGK